MTTPVRSLIFHSAHGTTPRYRYFFCSFVMKLGTCLSFLFAVLLGAAVAVAIKVGFALPGVLPTSDIFMFILESRLGSFALAKRGGEGGVLIAIAIRAFSCSVLAGAVAGAVLGRLRLKRALCYSALWVSIGNGALGYIAPSAASASNPDQVVAMQKNLGKLVWTDLWIYGWYFLELYVSFIVTRYISTKLESRAATI